MKNSTALKKVITYSSLALGFFVARYVLNYYGAEIVAEKSYSGKWPEELRQGFVEGCISESPREHKSLFERYCPCMAKGIEKAGVIPTKFNSYKESQKEVEEKIGVLTSQYLESKDGRQLLGSCLERAQLALQLEGPRGGGGVSPASIQE